MYVKSVIVIVTSTEGLVQKVQQRVWRVVTSSVTRVEKRAWGI